MVTIYNVKETNFESLGLGVLQPISCVITEQLNNVYELELVHIYDIKKKYLLIENQRILGVDTPSGRQLFRIYRVIPTLDNITVNARHIFYDLLDNYSNFKMSGQADVILQKFVESFRTKMNFNFSTDITENGSIICENDNPVSAFLREDEDNPSFVKSFNCEMLRDNFNIKFLKNIGKDRGFTIRYGKNLIGLRVEENIENVVTVLRAQATQDIDIGGGQTMEVTFSIDLTSENIDKYLYPKYGFHDFGKLETRDPEEGREQLEKLGKEFLKTVENPEINIQVDFVELSKTKEYEHLKFLQELKLEDIVAVYNEKLNFMAQAKLISYAYDCLLKKYNNLELGSFLIDLSKVITLNKFDNKTNKNKIKDLEDKFNNTEEQILKLKEKLI